ncbi:MAG: hypothetical protein A2Y33_10135 [Spirochaetes bacterium GWF1_51_8]|nr:MAG: hypothetical protein A2Y33_10135 [Spirochaetes bacterium GWF1_51_8]
MINKITAGFLIAFAAAFVSCANPVESAGEKMKGALQKMIETVKSGTGQIKASSVSGEIASFINQTTDDSKKCIDIYNAAVETNKLTPDQKAKAEEGLSALIGEKIKVFGEFQSAIGESIIRLSNNQAGIAEVQSALQNSKVFLNF